MNPPPIHISLDQPDTNNNQFELFKYLNKYCMYTSVPKNEWSSHLKRLYDFYEAIYRFIDVLSKG